MGNRGLKKFRRKEASHFAIVGTGRVASSFVWDFVDISIVRLYFIFIELGVSLHGLLGH